MNEPTQPAPKGNLLSAYLGLNALPLLILADSLLAMRRDWHPRTAGALGLLVSLAAVLPILVLVALSIGPLRRFVRRRAAQFWLMSFSVLIAWLIANVAIVAALQPPNFHLRPADTTYEFEPDAYAMPGVFGNSTYVTNAQGLRGSATPTEAGPYRVLCIGGGATECVYVEQAETWPQRLMQRLNEAAERRWWVASAGVLDYGASDHAKFLAQSPLVDDMDCVILLSGANDLTRYLMSLPRSARAGPYWYRSPLFDTLKYVWNAVLENGYYVDRTGEHLSLLRLGRVINEKPLDFDHQIELYKVELRRAVAAAKESGVRIVLVTHPVLWDYFLTSQSSKRLWLARVNPKPRTWIFLNAADLLDAIERYNTALIEVAKEHDVEYVDVASQMNGNELMFYDDFHFNDRGCDRFAELLAEYFRANPPGEGG